VCLPVAEFIGAGDVRMPQLAADAQLVLEAKKLLVVLGNVREEHFEGDDIVLEQTIRGAEHLAHAAASELCGKLVAFRDQRSRRYRCILPDLHARQAPGTATGGVVRTVGTAAGKVEFGWNLLKWRDIFSCSSFFRV